MLSQRLASWPPYEPGRGRRVAHQCPGARTPLLREPRSPEGNGKGSRKEEMGEERASRGKLLCDSTNSWKAFSASCWL